jgi:hypothetical protein
MAIHIRSFEPATAPVETAQPRTGGRVNLTDEFRTLVSHELQTQRSGSAALASSGGIAAAGAASAAARSAATAAAASAAATASSTATAPGTTAATGASPATALTADPKAAPTAEQVFGANPWMTDPTGTGPGGLTFGYNPIYFATASTAAEVAQMVGGKVVQDDEFSKTTPGQLFIQQQPNEMVELPDGALINPGLIASLYTHGYPNSMVNQAIANEVAGAEASVASTGT